MANVCNFTVTARGDPAELRDLAKLLLTDSEPERGEWRWNPLVTDPGASFMPVYLSATCTDYGSKRVGARNLRLFKV